MKIIDLSIPVEDGLPSDPPPQVPHIEYLRHKDNHLLQWRHFGERSSGGQRLGH